MTFSEEARLIAWHSSVIRDETGRIVATLSSGEDITDWKAANHELAWTKKLLEAVIDQTPIPMGIALADGTIATFNDACKELLGFEDELHIRPGLDY